MHSILLSLLGYDLGAWISFYAELEGVSMANLISPGKLDYAHPITNHNSLDRNNPMLVHEKFVVVGMMCISFLSWGEYGN